MTAGLHASSGAIEHGAHLAEGVGEDLIRLSAGLEQTEDLLDDLRQALSSV